MKAVTIATVCGTVALIGWLVLLEHAKTAVFDEPKCLKSHVDTFYVPVYSQDGKMFWMSIEQTVCEKREQSTPQPVTGKETT